MKLGNFFRNPRICIHALHLWNIRSWVQVSEAYVIACLTNVWYISSFVFPYTNWDFIGQNTDFKWGTPLIRFPQVFVLQKKNLQEIITATVHEAENTVDMYIFQYIIQFWATDNINYCLVRLYSLEFRFVLLQELWNRAYRCGELSSPNTGLHACLRIDVWMDGILFAVHINTLLSPVYCCYLPLPHSTPCVTIIRAFRILHDT
jgi:hypothetical protein